MKTHSVAPRVRAWLAILLACTFSAATADVEKKPGAARVVPKAPAPGQDEDPALKRLALRLADWEKAEGKMTVDGLAARAFIAATPELSGGAHGSPLDILVEDIVENPIPADSVVVTIEDRPGLGIVLDETAIERYRVSF